MKITVLVEIYGGIPEVSYIGDDEGAKALWMGWMEDLETRYADRKDIRNEDGSVSCDMNDEINTRTSWSHGYFCFHKTEYRVDSMDADPEAIARLATKALARMAEEAAQDSDDYDEVDA
jgi:hypothetical protein